MKDVGIENTRSVVLLGHTGSGKTSLLEAMLVKLGVTSAPGSVTAGTSVSDYTDEEKDRKISIYSSVFNGAYKTKRGRASHLFLIDTPGYDEFFGQVVGATRAADVALVVVDAGSGVQVGTAKVWKRVQTLKRAAGIVLTGLDRENADFGRAVAAIQSLWGKRCLPVVLPLPDGAGVVDVLGGKDVPADMAAQVEEAKGHLVEIAAETNDALIEKYLGGEPLSAEELANGLRGAVREGKLVPIFAALSLKGAGITELLDGVVALFPSPVEVPVPDAEGKPLPLAADAPFVGLVWKTVTDPFAGRLAYVRVYAGTLKDGMELANGAKGDKERAGAVLVVNGKKQDAVPEAGPGDIVALAKLKATGLGETLCELGQKVVLPPIQFPNPVSSFAVRAQRREDTDRIGLGLARLAEDDPTIRVDRNAESHELILSGMGDVHLDVALGQMKKRSNVSVELSTPKICYKETVTAKGEGRYKHKKQSGGRGQYGEVYARVEPMPPGDEQWFVDEIFGGSIPRNFVPAVEKGFVEGMSKGTIAGYPVVRTRAVVYDGSYHEVDSSEIAFKIAASRAFNEAMKNARPVLLEPIVTVHVTIPEQYMGDVNGDLNQKRGRILGVGLEDGLQVVTAEVPQAEMFRYASELRSITGGRGSFEMEFARYDVVPGNIAQKVVAACEKAKQEAEA